MGNQGTTSLRLWRGTKQDRTRLRSPFLGRREVNRREQQRSFFIALVVGWIVFLVLAFVDLWSWRFSSSRSPISFPKFRPTLQKNCGTAVLVEPRITRLCTRLRRAGSRCDGYRRRARAGEAVVLPTLEKIRAARLPLQNHFSASGRFASSTIFSNRGSPRSGSQ
jgi:hypothetical protein